MNAAAILTSRIRIAVVCLFFLGNGYGCGRLKGDDSKKVIATVGANTITVKDLKDSLKRLLPEGTEGIQGETLLEIKRNLLNELIEEELILKEAEKRGIDATEEELANESAMLKEAYGEDAFENVIISLYDSVEKWEEDIKRKFIVRKTIKEVINARITEDEARTYFERHAAEYEMPERAKARMIVVASEKEAERAKERLKTEDFAQVAKDMSIGPEAKDGGDLGFFSKGEMPVEFEDVIFALPAGRTSDAVKTPYGYHIFKVEGREAAKKLGFNEAKTQIMKKLKAEKAEKNYREWVNLLKKDTPVEIKEELL